MLGQLIGGEGRPARGIPKVVLLQNLPTIGAQINAAPPGTFDALLPGAVADGSNSAAIVDIFVGAGGNVTLNFLDIEGAENSPALPLNANATYTIYLCGTKGIRARGGAGTTVTVVMTQIIFPATPLSAVRESGLTDLHSLGNPSPQEQTEHIRQQVLAAHGDS